MPSRRGEEEHPISIGAFGSAASTPNSRSLCHIHRAGTLCVGMGRNEKYIIMFFLINVVSNDRIFCGVLLPIGSLGRNEKFIIMFILLMLSPMIGF